ncbi:MAG: excinuclease ABC subunit C, partial [Clostridiaceae bacterium]|nr:excinuclease ABC subunit C [Clostridiaceae bacterium]
IASQNVAVCLENSLKTRKKEEQDWEDAWRSLAGFLKTTDIPSRVEAYDISSTGSTEITGSIVVFEKGKALTGEYRRFKIKSLEGLDDYASMREMVSRRFRRGEEFLAFPDLILVDGGIGHVNTVTGALKSLGLEIPVLGMVKDDEHQTRGLVSPEGEYDLSANASLLRFVASIQNEAHRFAVEYNRKLRGKRYRESILDKIPGVGEKRKRELVKHFGSVKKIMDAGVDELTAVEGISRKTAENIYNFFRGFQDKQVNK